MFAIHERRETYNWQLIGVSLSEPYSSEDNLEVWCLSLCLSTYGRLNKVRMHAYWNMCVTKYTCAHTGTQSACKCKWDQQSVSTRVQVRASRFREMLVIPHKEGVQEETSKSVKLELQKQQARLAHRRENDRRRRAQVQSQETAEQHEARLFLQRQQDRARRTQLSCQETAEQCEASLARQREQTRGRRAQAQPCHLWTKPC